MWGEYKHIQQYEAEIQRLKSEGYTHRETGQTLGFTKTQVKKFVERYNIKQRKIAAGMALKKRGRPPKNYSISETDKVAQLKYILARKEAKIKQLETENELMRDFLSHTERK